MTTGPRAASTTALWFSIDAAFAEIDEVCTEARAAELAAHAVADELRLVRSLSGGSRRTDDDAPEPSVGRYPRAADLARDIAFRETHAGGADLVELRARLRKRLTWLKGKLAEALNDYDVYYALFPIVVYTDELVFAVSHGAAARWESLQSELYEMDNGGEVFFSILEERLRQQETHPIIFEIFYFCLSDGFMGMYSGDPRKLDEYKARLAERLRVEPVKSDDLAQKEPAAVELIDFPWRYYAAAGASIFVTYILLRWLAWAVST